MRLCFMTLLALIGCTATDDVSPADVAVDDTGPTLPPPLVEDPIDLADVTAMLEDATGAVMTMDAVTCMASLAVATLDMGITCPGGVDSANWDAEACATQQGSTYWGEIETDYVPLDFANSDLDPQHLDVWGPIYAPGFDGSTPLQTIDVDGVWSDGTVVVTDPQGRYFQMAGTFARVAVGSQGMYAAQQYLRGICRWDAPPKGSWLERDLQPLIWITQLNPIGTDYRHLHLRGTVSGFEGAFTAIEFRDNLYRPTTLGGTCDLEPDGVIALRRASGEWVEVRYDPTDSCDGCGAVIGPTGYDHGTACADFSAMEQPIPHLPDGDFP